MTHAQSYDKEVLVRGAFTNYAYKRRWVGSAEMSWFFSKFIR